MSYWVKHGNIFHPGNHPDFSSSHAQLPIVAKGQGSDEPLVFFSGRDQNNRSMPFASRLIQRQEGFTLDLLSTKPLMGLGEPGAFDDCGVMPTAALWVDGVLLIYYIGWNVRNTVPYHNAIGLAKFDPDTLHMERLFEGPVMDRNRNEPFFIGTMDVLLSKGQWKAWYLSCTAWSEINGHMEPQYLIRNAHSDNGLDWIRDGTISVPYTNDFEAIAGASVIEGEDTFQMYYSFRSTVNYRVEPASAYRIGFAKSHDGRGFERMDGIMDDFSADRQDWEKEMQAYPHVFSWQGQQWMLYNGNGFGQSGIGLAQLIV